MAKLVITIEVPMSSAELAEFEQADVFAQGESVSDHLKEVGYSYGPSIFWNIKKDFNPWRLLGEPDYIASDFLH
tara:strand:- start:291 stop:512 length:222 start_codon:yes stop_codon:yes gene_type:complete